MEEEEEKREHSHDMGHVPDWVKMPAAAGTGAPDPMEGIKTCLFEGKTLPECTESYRTNEPQSGVQGLQALLVKGMDREVANVHAHLASQVVGRSAGIDSHAASGRPCSTNGGVLRGSAAHVGEMLKKSNATQHAILASKQGHKTIPSAF